MADRDRFEVVGAKPSRYPSSVEALTGRVLKGQELPRVNVLVDLYLDRVERGTPQGLSDR